MKIDVKKLTYAKYASGGEDSAIVYTGGKMLTDQTVRVEYSTERDDTSFHADGHRIDHDNSITGCNMTVEIAQLTADIVKDILGWQQEGSTSVYLETGESSPYVGIGFAIPEKYKGARTYRGLWVYKIQFGMDSDSVNTKGDSLEYQTDSLTGSGVGVTLTEGGPEVFRAVMINGASLAAVETWLRGMAGISG